MEQQIFTVTALTGLLKEVLETTFGRIIVEGEISNFRPSQAGHWYFTLKDADAALSAVMFKFKTFSVRQRPTDGQRVRVTGKLSVYEVRGTYQIICESIQPVGTGDILQMLEQRKQQFLQEGLFDQERKRPLPLLPARVVLITSPTGAAVRDILSVLKRRNANIRVTILPVTVQGERAASEIAAMIEYANRHLLGDVIITGRGGGSIEDLLPFSEETVVRAAAGSQIPVISAVGHETDWSLLDYAADLRAPTPSAAAELVTAEQQSLQQRIADIHRFLRTDMQRRTEQAFGRIRHLSADYLAEPMQHRLATYSMHIDELSESIVNRMERTITQRRHDLQMLTSRIQAASPREIMKQGYAAVVDPFTGKSITSVQQTSPGSRVRTIFADGYADSTVQTIHRGAEDGEL